MAEDFELALDRCVDRLNRGESLESVLSDYPQDAHMLEPLLRTMGWIQTACSFSPSEETKREDRLRFFAALERRQNRSLWRRMLSQPVLWASLAAVLVIAVMGIVGVRSVFFPEQAPVITVPGPFPEGNFIFLVSDDINAINEFSQLLITVDKVSLLKSDSASRWIEFTPDIREFDLTLLPGDKTQELWRGNLPEGEYTKVVLHVNAVHGKLKSNRETIEIKLPSNKLQISHSFHVSAGHITSFVYDLTVVHAGKSRNGGKYLLKPQIGESGAVQRPVQDASKMDSLLPDNKRP